MTKRNKSAYCKSERELREIGYSESCYKEFGKNVADLIKQSDSMTKAQFLLWLKSEYRELQSKLKLGVQNDN